MTHKSLPAAIGSTASRVGFTAGCGGAGSLAALALVHKAGASAIAAGAFTACAVNATASVFRSLPRVIEAISNLLTARIRARADAKATVIYASVRAELARAGLDPGKTQQAGEMQRLLSVNPDLPQDRRLTDETLIKLGGSRARGSGTAGESGASPDSPGSNSRKAAASKVVAIRSDP